MHLSQQTQHSTNVAKLAPHSLIKRSKGARARKMETILFLICARAVPAIHHRRRFCTAKLNSRFTTARANSVRTGAGRFARTNGTRAHYLEENVIRSARIVLTREHRTAIRARLTVVARQAHLIFAIKRFCLVLRAYFCRCLCRKQPERNLAAVSHVRW